MQRIEKKKNLEKGKALKNLCEQVIPAGSATLAKSPNRLCPEYSPFYANNAKGCYFWDVDGNKWLDCEMSMGTAIWGYCRKEIDNAIINQLQHGTIFSIPSTLEYELALKLLSRYPQYEAVKYFKNGADAVYAAVRSARRLTKRIKTLSCEYHGWLDWSCFHYYHLSPDSMGISKYALKESISCISDIDIIIYTIEKYKNELACVVLCPANYDMKMLHKIVNLCNSKNIMVIFDEVTSGMRFARGGATQLFGLIPDYLCISKGLANGLPLAVTLGKRENIMIMENLKISNAHAGEHLSLAAAIASEELLSNTVEWPSWGKATELLRIKVENTLVQLGSTCTLKIVGNVGYLSIIETDLKKSEKFRLFFISYLSQYNIFSKGFIIFCDAHSYQDIQFVCEIICRCVKDYQIQL